ncbi:MAG: trigger factor [Bacteroidales bacterium]|jgi:trigger factor|nr:trigger factor [Bacteroidales bacterium]
MNISREKTNDLTEIIKIEIEKADYEKAVEHKLKDYQKNYNHPGFRPGKVPMSLVKKMVGGRIIADEVDKLVSESLYNYIEEPKIKILGSPLPDMTRQKEIDLDSEEHFEFYFEIALAPEIDVELDKSIVIPEYDIEIEEEVVQKYITDTQTRLGKTIEPEKSELNDYLYGTFVQLSQDGNILENGITHSATVAIDMVTGKTIQKKLIGAKVGDVIVFNPMKAYKNETEVAAMLNIDKEIAKDLKSEFNYTVEKITRREPAELNEELFKQVFPQDDIHSVAEFEDRIRTDAKISLSSETQRKFMQDAIDVIVEKFKFSLNDDFMKRWILATNTSSENKVSPEELEIQYPKYEKGLRWQVIEALLEKKYELKVTREDVRNHLMELFMGKAAGLPEVEERANEFVDKFMSNNENAEQIRSIYDHLMEQNIVRLLKEKVTVEVKNILYKDFIELMYGK